MKRINRPLRSRRPSTIFRTYGVNKGAKNNMKEKPNIIHLGGEHTVTSSCHLLQANGLNILVVGLHKGMTLSFP